MRDCWAQRGRADEWDGQSCRHSVQGASDGKCMPSPTRTFVSILLNLVWDCLNFFFICCHLFPEMLSDFMIRGPFCPLVSTAVSQY